MNGLYLGLLQPFCSLSKQDQEAKCALTFISRKLNAGLILCRRMQLNAAACMASTHMRQVHVSKLQIKCIKMSNSVHTCTIPIFGHLRHDYFGRFCCLKYTVWVQTCMNWRHDALSTRLISGTTAFDGFQLNVVFWLYGSHSSSLYSATRLRSIPGSRDSVPDKDRDFYFLPSI